MALPRNYNSDYVYLQYIDDRPINLLVNEFGIDDLSQKKSLPARYLPRYSFHFILKGKGTYTFGGKTYPLQANDLIVIYPGIQFTLTSNDSEAWTYCWINFDGKDAPSLLKQSLFSVDAPIYTVKQTKKMHAYIQSLRRCNQTTSNLRLRTLGVLINIFALISEERTPNGSINLSKDFYVLSTQKYIQTNYQSADLRIESLCKELSISHSHLCRLFHKQTGQSIYKYLLSYRMQNAKLLLENTDEKIVVIAHAVGYNDLSYFCSEFKRIHGVSPTEYRCDFKKFKKDIALSNKFTQETQV